MPRRPRSKKNLGALRGRTGRVTSINERKDLIASVDELAAGGVTREFAAASLGSSLRTLQRYQSCQNIPDGRKGALKKVHNKLSPGEESRLIEIACSEEFQDLPPAQIVAMLAARGQYLGSERTLARLLKTKKLNTHRRREKAPQYRRPEPLVATKPCQVWSWDVTYLPSKIVSAGSRPVVLFL